VNDALLHNIVAPVSMTCMRGGAAAMFNSRLSNSYYGVNLIANVILQFQRIVRNDRR